MEKIVMTEELTERFLERYSGNTRKSYRQALTALYAFLPPEKALDEHTWERWKEAMSVQGRLPATVNQRLYILNGFLDYAGRPEWRGKAALSRVQAPQPELTQAEYRRLLSAAKATGKVQSYLLIQVLGGLGIPAKELHQLTAEAVRAGTVALENRTLELPETLRGNIMEFNRQRGILTGPVFRMSDGRPADQWRMYYLTRCVSEDARVAPEKATPRCLEKLYRKIRREIQERMTALTDKVLWDTQNMGA